MTHILFVEHTKMFNLVNITNEHIEQHNLKWPYITDHPSRILIIAGSGSVKTNKKNKIVAALLTRFICIQKT